MSADSVRRVVTRRSSMIARRHIRRHVVARQSAIIAHLQGGKFFHHLNRIFIPPGGSATVRMGASLRFTASAIVRPCGPTSSLRRGLHTITRRGGTMGAIVRQHGHCLRHLSRVLATHVSDLLGSCRARALLHTQARTRCRRTIQHHSTGVVDNVTMNTILLSTFFLVVVNHSVAQDGHCHHRLRRTHHHTRSLLTIHRGLVLTVARSFGTPLNSVVNCTSLLSHLAISRHRQFCLSGVGASSRRLLGLIISLLSFRHLSLGGTRVGQIAFRPSHLLRRVRIDFRPLATTGKLTLRYSVTPRLNNACVYSPLHLHRVVGGLLSGTIGFASRNGIAVATHCRSHQLMITVTSANGNVRPTSQRHVFRRFAHLPNTRNGRKFKLKLSVIHVLMRLLRNAVSMSDIPNGKDAFAVCVPVCPMEDRKQEVGSRRSKYTTAPGNGSSFPIPRSSLGGILLVSSSHVRLALATTVLRRDNVGSISYLRLSRLLSTLHATAFSILLASIRVPTVGNFSLLGLLHTSGVPRTRSIPIVTIATHDSVRHRRFAIRKFTKYLRGPFAIDRLLRRLGVRSGKVRIARISRASTYPKCGFSSLATFSISSPRTTGSVLRDFITRAHLGTRHLRGTIRGRSISRVTTISRGVVPLFALVKTTRLITLLGLLRASRKIPFAKRLGRRTLTTLILVRSIVARTATFPW